MNGAPAWGTVWFRLTGTVPAGYPKGKPLELILDLGWYPHSCGGHIEGLVYRADGTAIKAVHPLNYWVPFMDAEGNAQVPVAEDGSFTLYLEAASNPLLLGVPPFIETELGDHATGKPDEPYVFKSADLAEFDERYENYSVDLDVVSSLMEFADKQSPRYWQLAKALQRSLNAYDERNPESVEAARAALAGVLAKPANASAMNVSAIGHAHIDSAWLWPVRETRRKVARTVSNALALMDADPDFKYAMSSAQQYAWLEEDHPDIFKRMKRRIEEGRFIPVGGMWVEADGMLPAGESLIRQIAYGRKYFKEHLGVEPKGVWLPDSFGYTGAWPQIARRAGYEWFLTQKISWNDTTKFPHHSFMWEGIDGSRIFTHFPPADTYAAWCKVQELDYAEKNFRDKDLSDRSLLLFGFGDGGGGPTRNMMEHLHRYENLEGVSKVSIEEPNDFFDKAHQQLAENAGPEMPVWKGELYLELHRGTLTSQQDMKRGCRQEESLLRTVEYLGAAAVLSDPEYVYPREELDRIWKTLLLNQFHDILPGSAIAWVHREAREDYRRDPKRLAEIAQDMCAVLRKANPQADLLAEARISQFRNDGVSWRASRINEPTNALSVLTQTLDNGRVLLANGVLSVTIEADGTISSLLDEEHGRELVPAGTRLGRYELLRDEPAVWDAWEIERESLLMANAMTGSIESVDTENGAARVRVRTADDDTVITTTITLRPVHTRSISTPTLTGTSVNASSKSICRWVSWPTKRHTTASMVWSAAQSSKTPHPTKPSMRAARTASPLSATPVTRRPSSTDRCTGPMPRRSPGTPPKVVTRAPCSDCRCSPRRPSPTRAPISARTSSTGPWWPTPRWAVRLTPPVCSTHRYSMMCPISRRSPRSSPSMAPWCWTG